MKKYLISALMVLVFGVGANAQTVISNHYGSNSSDAYNQTTITRQEEQAKDDFRGWGPTFEIGYGFLEGKAYAYKATIGANYSFTNYLYAQAQIGYNSFSLNEKEYDVEMHFITLPFELGYRLTTEDRRWGVIPFAGIGLNIGLSGKLTDSGEKSDLKIGGKMGVAGRAGLRINLGGFHIIGSYHFPLNNKQEEYFGKDAYPEISIGFSF